MEDREQLIREFFVHYERLFNEALQGKEVVEATAVLFADNFIAANPLGVTCGRNDELFRNAIPDGYAFYRSIGIRFMNISSQHISRLDDNHAFNKVEWKAFYQSITGRIEEVAFTVIYLLQLLNNRVYIFGYITGDEQKALRERGLIS